MEWFLLTKNADGEIRFRIDGVLQPTWPTGTYRLQVLVGAAIREIEVGLPDRFEVVPGPAERSGRTPRRRAPALAVVESVESEPVPVRGDTSFVIAASTAGTGHDARVAPEVVAGDPAAGASA